MHISIYLSIYIYIYTCICVYIYPEGADRTCKREYSSTGRGLRFSTESYTLTVKHPVINEQTKPKSKVSIGL